MAEAAHEHHTGDQDISEQVATFHLVGGMLKWGSLAIAVLLTMLVLWFCTSAGFFSGLVAGLVLLVLGVFFLRSKPDSGH
jgi:hypothetical protein